MAAKKENNKQALIEKEKGRLQARLQNRGKEGTTITPQYRGPRATHFDFHLTFPDRFEVLVKLDSPQHFWVSKKHYTVEGCKRDLRKEKWAVSRCLSVVVVMTSA